MNSVKEKIYNNEYYNAFVRLMYNESINILNDEKIISKNAEFSHFYATLLGKRFILGEESIINDSYFYLFIKRLF